MPRVATRKSLAEAAQQSPASTSRRISMRTRTPASANTTLIANSSDNDDEHSQTKTNIAATAEPKRNNIVARRSSRKALANDMSSKRWVANSSDGVDSMADDEVAEPAQKLTRSDSRRVLDSVVISEQRPLVKLEGKGRSARGSIASRSPVDSALSSTREASFDYDTPVTTATHTPAEGLSAGKRRRRGPLPNLNNPATFKLGGSSLTSRTSRRRGGLSTSTSALLVDDSDDEDGDERTRDEQLARQLQEEEFGAASEASSSALSSEELTESEDDEPLVKRRRISKHTPEGRLASRVARNRLSGAGTLDNDDGEDDAGPSFKLDDTESDFDPEDDMPLQNRRGSVSTLTSLDSAASTPAPQSAMAGVQNRAAQSTYRRRRMAEMRSRRFNGIHDRKAARRAKLVRAHPEILTMWDTLAKVPIIKPVQAAQPEAITRRLKPFQLEGLDWMTRQEKSQYKGGLLGDEMGMGKTIQAVSLIMSDFPAKEPSLVLVPPVALMQWSNEINDYTNGKLKVLIVHNTNAKSKNLSLKTIQAHNVVIMSYNSLESMFRKQEKGWSRGENIVKEDSPMHAVHWHRIILDEAHSIKTRTTGVAKACFALQANHKWCLSGTPVQNRIGEFFSLLRFLEVRPFADYFCEKCPCAQLHWSVGEDYMCTQCRHSAAEHRSVFNEELLNPITGDSLQLRSEALDKLHMITARVMLRRMKKDHTSSMELPPKEIVIHNEFFGEIERDFSSSIMANTTRKFDTYVAQGVMLNNYANIFGLIMQMRQVANHPDLITRKSAEGGQNVIVCNICDEPAEEAIKSSCRGNKCHFCRSCVKNYIQTCEASGSQADCPRCHIPLTIDYEQPEIVQDEDEVKKSSIINRINMENWTSSTKIEMLVYDLYKLRSKKQTLKSIVFSQFTSMLQLIDWRLRRAGFNTVMLDGSMTPVQRQRSIDYFMTNPDVEVFLVSLKAGGVALNLTEASRVFIVDPWWNPAAEWQSADRCHRIGQTRPCVITRLVIEDSVESRMVMLQEKKASMISGTINNDKVAMDKLSPEDLQFLFRGT